MPASAANATPYLGRGWCIFEQRLSGIVKDNDCYLQISNDTQVSFWPGMRLALAASRPAPMLPAGFASLVSEGMGSGAIKFTNGKDATEIVIPQYEKGFDRMMKEVISLEFCDLGWQDAEALQFVTALAHAHANGGLRHLTKIDLSKNQIGDEGMRALAGLIASGAMPKLRSKSLVLTFNRAHKHALDEVKAAFKSRKEGGAKGPVRVLPADSDGAAAGGAQTRNRMASPRPEDDATTTPARAPIKRSNSRSMPARAARFEAEKRRRAAATHTSGGTGWVIE